METNMEIGRRGEDLACEYLRKRGMLVLDRNWRPAASNVRGELDIVARDGDDLVIIEVKARRSIAYGYPVEAVTKRKLKNLRSLALTWLEQRSVHAPNMRFDVVSVIIPPAGHPVIEHVRAV